MAKIELIFIKNEENKVLDNNINFKKISISDKEYMSNAKSERHFVQKKYKSRAYDFTDYR